MSITVVGSVAYDTVTTLFGKSERQLGGSAIYFSSVSYTHLTLPTICSV